VREQKVLLEIDTGIYSKQGHKRNMLQIIVYIQSHITHTVKKMFNQYRSKN